MILGREPALILGAFGALVAVAVGFGLELTGEQQALVMAAVVAVLSLITRSQVTPMADPRIARHAASRRADKDQPWEP
jgi:H+/Cl- antiporter ClcA